MMRQLGGSFGIAMVNTYLTRRSAVHRTDLVSQLAPGDPQVTSRLAGYTQYFIGKGATVADAQHQALGLLDATVNRQSSALSFGDTYLLLGAIFLGSLPFLLLARKRKQGRPQVALADH
jgi:DHA2 family multidrug resistance protein